MFVLETERLALRNLAPADAPFILALLNDPDWLRYIGDRGVHTLGEAAAYIEHRTAKQAEQGFGLYLVERRADGLSLGLCGLVQRDFLDDLDLGFAFLPQFRGQGYAYEAAAAVLRQAVTGLGLTRVVAITTPDNARSAALLERLGFRFERPLAYPGEEAEVLLFARQLGPPPQS